MSLRLVAAGRCSMGTEFQVILPGEDRAFLEAAGNAALDRIEEIEARLSHYQSTSDISDINVRAAYEPVLVDPELFDLLKLALQVSRDSGGAFDPTIGSLVRCWGFFRGQGAMPDSEAVKEALQVTGAGLVLMDEEARTIRFTREGVKLQLGALGKGYAVDQAVEVLTRCGVRSGLIHGGASTIYALGAPPDEEFWEIGLKNPLRPSDRIGYIRLADQALSTSGDYEQFFEHEGRRYSHIIDPRSGYPSRGMSSAAVVAPSAALSDALSTALFVQGAGQVDELLRNYPGTSAVFIIEPPVGAEPIAVARGAVQFLPADPAGTAT